MPSAKAAAACALTALALAACGSTSKPQSGQVGATTVTRAGRGVVDDPRTKHVKCLQEHHLPVVSVSQTELRIGAPRIGPAVTFEPTPGAAQEAQIRGNAQGAEAIGSALLYPNRGSDQELNVIEACMTLGVTG